MVNIRHLQSSKTKECRSLARVLLPLVVRGEQEESLGLMRNLLPVEPSSTW